MTREKAIRLLTTKRAQPSTDYQMAEVYTMAIKALSQECVGSTHKHVGNALDMRCGDLVNRQAVLNILLKYTLGESRIAEELRALPPVTQKSGEWIKVKSGDKDFPESIVCSRCNNENSHLDFNENAEPIGKVFVTSKYCPNCGARMESEE